MATGLGVPGQGTQRNMVEGDSEHPLGWAPRPPQAGAPGSLEQMVPHWPYRRLRTPPGLDSPSPPGRCARFSEADGPPLALQETPNTPWAGLPVPPRPVCPVLRRRRLPMGLGGFSDHPLGWTPRPPQAGRHHARPRARHQANHQAHRQPCHVRDALPGAGCPATCGMPCLVWDALPSAGCPPFLPPPIQPYNRPITLSSPPSLRPSGLETSPQP